MNEYINQAKDIFNLLLAAADPISLREQVIYLVSGLNFDYNSLITTLTYKKKMPTLEEVFIMMRVHEQQVQRMQSFSVDHQLNQANFAKQVSISTLSSSYESSYGASNNNFVSINSSNSSSESCVVPGNVTADVVSHTANSN